MVSPSTIDPINISLHFNMGIQNTGNGIIWKNSEPVVSPYKDMAIEISLHFYMGVSKYGKWHYIFAIVGYNKGVIGQSSHCSLPTVLEASDQKSENVKSSATPMPTYHLIFVIIRWIKTQLFAQGTWTCVIPLRSHINLIVGPTGPNNRDISVGRTPLFSVPSTLTPWSLV